MALVLTANGCGPAGSVRSCPQRAWSKGWIERVNGVARMETRQSFNWNTTGTNGACTGLATQWVGLNPSLTYTYCGAWYVFPYFADGDGGYATAFSQGLNDDKSSDVWGRFDWNVWNGDSGRVHIHTYVQGFKSGNAHTHCWLVAVEGSGRPWGTELHCNGGNG